MTPTHTKPKTIKSTCIPLNRNNVDTDQIIPARFLKGTTKVGLGKDLFADWRYEGNGSSKPDFSLNDAKYTGGKILVAAHNFGCGSSREHAPWALKDYGFVAILAISFADIFRNNSLKNGLLTIPLPEEIITVLLEQVEADPSLQVSIDLEKQEVQIPGQPAQRFEIDPYRKTCLMEGLDDVGYTLSYQAEIGAYDRSHS